MIALIAAATLFARNKDLSSLSLIHCLTENDFKKFDALSLSYNQKLCKHIY